MNARQILAQNLLRRLSNKPRKGFTLIELLVVVVIIGILASVALPSFVGAQDKARNSSVQANIGTVRMGLEQFGTDNNGSYPATADVLNDGATAGSEGILYNNYMPGNRMPLSPWCKQPQTTAVDVTGVDINTAADIAGGASPTKQKADATKPAINMRIADGKVNTAPGAEDEYGAVLYDYDTNTQTYVLYGVGKRNKDAIIVTGVSNNGQ